MKEFYALLAALIVFEKNLTCVGLLNEVVKNRKDLLLNVLKQQKTYFDP